MRKEYRVRYKKADDFYGLVIVGGEGLTAERAKIKALDFLEASSTMHFGIDDVYEINNEDPPTGEEEG